MGLASLRRAGRILYASRGDVGTRRGGRGCGARRLGSVVASVQRRYAETESDAVRIELGEFMIEGRARPSGAGG